MRKGGISVKRGATDLRTGREAYSVDRGDVQKGGKESRRDKNGDPLRGPKLENLFAH